MPRGELPEFGVGALVLTPFVQFVDRRFDRLWAEKHYVDKKRIGVWGWVSIYAPGFSCPSERIISSRTVDS